jgi:hypothetical protein
MELQAVVIISDRVMEAVRHCLTSVQDGGKEWRCSVEALAKWKKAGLPDAAIVDEAGNVIAQPRATIGGLPVLVCDGYPSDRLELYGDNAPYPNNILTGMAMKVS